MNIHKKKYQSRLSSRMTVYFSVMIILSSVFLILFFSSRMLKSIDQEAIDTMNTKLDNQSKMFEMFVETYDQSTLNFRADEKFMNVLLKENISYDEMEYIKNELNHYLIMQKNVEYAEFYMPIAKKMLHLASDNGLAVTKDNVALEHVFPLEYYESGMNCGKYSYVFASGSEEGDAAEQFSYVRIYIRIQDQSPLGILVLHFNENCYETILEDNIDQDTVFSAVFDGEDRPILMNSRRYYEENRGDIEHLLNSASEESEYVMTSDRQVFRMVKQVEDKKHVFVVSKSLVQKEIRITVLHSMFLLLGVIAIFSILIKILSDKITKPIIQLAEQMKKVEIDNQQPKREVDRTDEIGYLTMQFDQMLQKMNKLVHEKYISKLNENDARMKALQAQINPHFLYNTLQVISTQAMICNNWKIVEMVDALSSTYRYSVKMGDIVTVDQERINLENYLNISQSRFEELFEYQIRITENVGDFVIPKFSLQILAENALKHGMRSGVLHLTIGVEMSGESIRIFSQDDGIGFSEKKREKIYEEIRRHQNESSESHGLGLKNLYDRFVNMYGEGQVTFSCGTMNGITTVEFRIAKTQGDNDEDTDN